MAEHKFKIGQTIYFRPKRSSVPVNAPSGRYQLLGSCREGMESLSTRSEVIMKITNALREKAS
jgi:hypothetical protein